MKEQNLLSIPEDRQAPFTTPRRSTGAVVLAAGASRRMGSPKALLPWEGGGTLIEAWLAALRPRCGRCAVVVGAVVDPIAALLWPDDLLVINPRWAETGPYDSLRLGLAALGDSAQVLVTPVDAPPASSAELERLLATPPPAVLSWAGRPGHPALLDRQLINTILNNPAPSGGLSSLLTAATAVPADSGATLLNLNTPEDLARWRSYCSGM